MTTCTAARTIAAAVFTAGAAAIASAWPATASAGARAPHSPVALAVFAPDPGEFGFGARHAAAAMGIPCFFTHDADEAFRQPMVVMTGTVGGDFMTDAMTARVDAFVTGGGTLIVDDAESRSIENIAGIASLTPSAHRYRMRLDPRSRDPGVADLQLPEELTIGLGNKAEGLAALTQGYAPAADMGARVLARFDDGTAALLRRDVGAGRIYVTGLAYYDAVLRPQTGHAYDAARVYDNGFEPSADVPSLLLRAWYLHDVPGAVAADETPDGLAGALVITHDVDFVQSVDNMPAYAAAERAHGFAATYFVQTKIVRDIEDTDFYHAHAKSLVAKIHAEGADIASHSVAHSPDWRMLPIGTGNESAADYRPIVVRFASDHRTGLTLGASLSGEIRVSRALLEAAGPGIRVDALRSGYLLINRDQWAVMRRYGYRFDSSFAIGDVMTSFPYAMMEAQGGSRESGVTEFPIVIADAQGWVPMFPHLAAFERLIDDERAIHGVVTALIHDDVVADKLPTELALVAHARSRMWVGTIDAFGDFWSRRSETTLSAAVNADGTETVSISAPDGVDGLTLDFPGAVSIVSAAGTTAAPAQDESRAVVLGRVGAGAVATVTVRRR